MLSPTSTWPWSAVTTRRRPAGSDSDDVGDQAVDRDELGVVVVAQAVLVGDLVDAVVVRVDERLAGPQRAGAPRRPASTAPGSR